jgi:trehalose 6-phosphate phosphatase
MTAMNCPAPQPSSAAAFTLRMPRGLPPVPRGDRQCALFLDVDGCIIDFAPRPEEVVVPSDLIDLLRALALGLDGALALVSGRTIEELDRLFAPLELAVAGQHGFEWRLAGGLRHGAPQPPIAVVDDVRRGCQQVLLDTPGLLLEDKGFSFALHYRAVPDAAAELGRRARAIAAASHGAFGVQPGTFVYELKPSSCSKGAALRAFFRERPFAGRMPVMLGDDLTDESAFHVANARGGISIRVGPAPHPSDARYALADPAAARAWLADLLQAIG